MGRGPASCLRRLSLERGKEIPWSGPLSRGITVGESSLNGPYIASLIRLARLYIEVG